MVHALDEIRRILAPEGFLIDLRPLADRWSVEVACGRTQHAVGHLTDLPTGLADDEAANQALREAARHGWFVREIEYHFPFFYDWDSPGEMREYIREKWADFLELDEETFDAARSAWKEAGADCRVRVRAKMLLTRWRKS